MISQVPATEKEGGELEGWTLAALQAAERGQWDRVEEYYDKREAMMSRVVHSQEQIERLLAVDRHIQAQALVAKTAIAEQLRESFATRMRLKKLRSGMTETAGESGTLLMEA